MRPSSPTLLLAAIAIGITAGCASRGAEDRVVSQRDRARNHGPAYATIAYVPTDYARWSNGTIIINESGYEPAYVGSVGVNHINQEFAEGRSAESAPLLERLDRITARRASAPAASPADAPASAAADLSDPSASRAKAASKPEPMAPERATVADPTRNGGATLAEPPTAADSSTSAAASATTVEAAPAAASTPAAVTAPATEPVELAVPPANPATTSSAPVAPPAQGAKPVQWPFAGAGRRP